MGRIELPTSPLPRECSTTEPHGHRHGSGLGSNPNQCRLRHAQPPPSAKTVTLPRLFDRTETLERETGIEPASLAWKAKVLPLNYSRSGAALERSQISLPGGGGWIRTSVGVSQQIYSLPPLAARASLREPYIFSCSVNAVNPQVLLPQVKTPRP